MLKCSIFIDAIVALHTLSFIRYYFVLSLTLSLIDALAVSFIRFRHLSLSIYLTLSLSLTLALLNIHTIYKWSKKTGWKQTNPAFI